ISPNDSWGRSSDGDPSWTVFSLPTPMMSNLSTEIVQDLQMNNSLAIYPNPVTDNAIFKIWLEKPGKVTVEIIDGMGNVVSMFEEKHNIPGEIRVAWNCTNMHGESVDGGLYFCRIHAGNSLWTGKMIIH
ncbi:MAG: T9SS type A sorting domain-containing protein, partial [Bacteroidota bacterium]